MQEEQQNEEIDQFKKLSDSITNALKNLLDQIKKKLDEPWAKYYKKEDLKFEIPNISIYEHKNKTAEFIL